MSGLRRGVRVAWGFLRALTGDDAYDRYRHHVAARHPGQPVLDRRAYYLKRQREKWSGVNRCC